MSKAKYLTSVLAVLLGSVLISCNKSDDTPESLTYFEFSETAVEVEKNKGSVDIEVTWERVTERGGTLQFYVSTEGLPNPAVEGTDFTIAEKSLAFGATDKKKSLTVAIPASGSDGDKSFRLVMKSSDASHAALGKVGKGTNICLITLKD